MNIETLQQNWALVAGLVVLIPVILGVIGELLSQSRNGKLRAKAKVLKAARRQRSQCVRKVEALGEKLNALMERGDRVAPAKVEKAKAILSDAIAIAKTAEDQHLIAETQLRQYILEEFSPNRHDALQRRFLLLEPGT